MADDIILKDSDVPPIQEELTKLYSQGFLTDITLSCEDGKNFEAHRVLLAARSHYFYDLVPKLKSDPVIFLKGVKGGHLAKVLEYIYSGSTSVSKTQLKPILEVARSLQVKGLQDLVAADVNRSGGNGVFGAKFHNKSVSPGPSASAAPKPDPDQYKVASAMRDARETALQQQQKLFDKLSAGSSSAKAKNSTKSSQVEKLLKAPSRRGRPSLKGPTTTARPQKVANGKSSFNFQYQFISEDSDEIDKDDSNDSDFELGGPGKKNPVPSPPTAVTATQVPLKRRRGRPPKASHTASSVSPRGGHKFIKKSPEEDPYGFQTAKSHSSSNFDSDNSSNDDDDDDNSGSSDSDDDDDDDEEDKRSTHSSPKRSPRKPSKVPEPPSPPPVEKSSKRDPSPSLDDYLETDSANSRRGHRGPTINGKQILPVQCKGKRAEMHLSKYGNGLNGKCIKYKDKWMTPDDYEQVCGNKTKKYLESITTDYGPLKTLTASGLLKPHPRKCKCNVCCDEPLTSPEPIQPKPPKESEKEKEKSTPTQPKADIFSRKGRDFLTKNEKLKPKKREKSSDNEDDSRKDKKESSKDDEELFGSAKRKKRMHDNSLNELRKQDSSISESRKPNDAESNSSSLKSSKETSSSTKVVQEKHEKVELLSPSKLITQSTSSSTKSSSKISPSISKISPSISRSSDIISPATLTTTRQTLTPPVTFSSSSTPTPTASYATKTQASPSFIAMTPATQISPITTSPSPLTTSVFSPKLSGYPAISTTSQVTTQSYTSPLSYSSSTAYSTSTAYSGSYTPQTSTSHVASAMSPPATTPSIQTSKPVTKSQTSQPQTQSQSQPQTQPQAPALTPVHSQSHTQLQPQQLAPAQPHTQPQTQPSPHQQQQQPSPKLTTNAASSYVTTHHQQPVVATSNTIQHHHHHQQQHHHQQHQQQQHQQQLQQHHQQLQQHHQQQHHHHQQQQLQQQQAAVVHMHQQQQPGQKNLSRIGSIMQVRCKAVTALLYASKYESGSKGKCILVGDEWMTPNEFEEKSGSKAKKYLSSIKCLGRPLRAYVNSGELRGTGPPPSPKPPKINKPKPPQAIAPAPAPGQNPLGGLGLGVPPPMSPAHMPGNLPQSLPVTMMGGVSVAGQPILINQSGLTTMQGQQLGQPLITPMTFTLAPMEVQRMGMASQQLHSGQM